MEDDSIKIYYITRTYEKEGDSQGGCGGIRNYHVALLRAKYNVVVVTPNYDDEQDIVTEDMVSLHYRFRKVDIIAERIGLLEDYLDDWSERSYQILKNIVRTEDIVFATTGREIGCIKISSRLKSSCGCKMMINFHDSIDGTLLNKKKYLVNRAEIARKYVKNTDYAITVSNKHSEETIKTFPELVGKIKSIYRGYRYCNIHSTPKHSNVFRIVYAGTMDDSLQNIPFIIETIGKIDNCRLELIGVPTRKVINALRKYKNVILRDPMSYEKCMNYMKENADVGIVSIMNESYAVAVPSKLFDLINLEMPILGLMPDGDGKDLINSGFGLASHFGNTEEIISNVHKLMETDFYNGTVKYIKENKSRYSMDVLFSSVYEIIDSLVRD